MYAPIELSRVIVRWGLTAKYIFELAFMWLSYGLALFLISVIIQRRVKEKDDNTEQGEGND
jgi:hypothetical protein